ncbi:bola-like protein [Rhizodiscina lignyota]|uniref:Bola-like protein n=1 Tax=Rhizodiscina lignyota TaxID=1504668 RepID=A0A9P4M9F1_9PEZI|nr:bola-like protein [Rhizodiscina lignyota]
MSARTDAEATEMQNDTGITPEALKGKLVEKLGASHVDIEDMSGGCGQMFEAKIVSPQFAKKTTLARHRLVNSVLKEEIAAIHAWTPKCFTPEEWEKKQGNTAS